MEGSPPLCARDRSERSALLRRRQHSAGRRWQRVPAVAAAVAAAAEPATEPAAAVAAAAEPADAVAAGSVE